MRRVRLAGLVLAVGLAVVLATAATALAQPEFNPASGTFTVSGGAGTLKVATASDDVACSSSEGAGSIASAVLAGPFLLTFHGCSSEAKGSGTKCTVKSAGETNEGVILTGTLHAVLALALVAGESRWPGLWILPVGTSRFVTLEKNSCTPESEVEGSAVGLISPIGASQTTAKLVFDPQASATLEVCSGESVHIKGLEAYGATATEQTAAEVKFSQSIEIT